MKKITAILFIAMGAFLFNKAMAQTGGYATMRVFDCNRAIGMGTGYIAAKIFIVYEDSKTEEIALLPYTEKNEVENLKTINATINKLKDKGYFLITQYTTGDQGNLISDYTFLKQK
ncbi:MAG: hypothetical protein KA841_05845 [Chitinophagales bacterium]|jgi:hypothetical protein|nr:hypothetical protein [Chitinophagales bacterium]